MAYAVEVQNIVKKFPPWPAATVAVNDVSFNVEEGEIFGLLGPNGAGKTTLIRMLTCILKPTLGSAKIKGYDIRKEPTSVRKIMGVVSQAMTSDLDLTGRENLDIYGKYYDMPKKERHERAEYLIDIVGLKERSKDLVATYSGGMRRRLEMARGLMHKPYILFLDEPTIGLDPQSRRVMWELLQKIRTETKLTIFITTHYMEEADVLCNKVAIIDFGKIMALDSPSDLKKKIGGSLEDVFIHYTGKSIREGEPQKFNFLAGAGVPRKLF